MKLRDLFEDHDTSSVAKKDEKCAFCGKTIKAGEKIGVFNDNVMHKECFMKRFRQLGSMKVGIQAPEGWKEMLKGSPVDPTPFIKKRKTK